MKRIIRKIISILSRTKFAIVLSVIWQALIFIESGYLWIEWMVTGNKKPNIETAELVCNQCMFIFKSFERQNMSKRLYKSIQSYYAREKVIIADNSFQLLELESENLEII